MPNEALITQIENLLAEIVELGGDNERSQIVPNLTVQDASPTNLDGWLIVSDDRDGDNILARKVGSVVYSDNDLVNVMFLRGTEPIAFQQGSESSNNGIWEIVPSTSTDIFYDKGNVGIGNAAPTTPLDVTGTVTITDDILHAGDPDTKIGLTDDKISFDAGGLNMLALTETAQDLVEIGDVAGGGDVDVNFNNGQVIIQGSDGAVGIDKSPPVAKLDVVAQTTDSISFRLNKKTTATTGGVEVGRFEVESTGSPTAGLEARLGFNTDNLGGTLTNKAAIGGGVDGASNIGFLRFYTTNTANTLTERMKIDGTGNVGIGETSPTGIIHVKWASSAIPPRLEFTGAGSLPAAFVFFHNSASPANNDGLGQFSFAGNNDAGAPEEIQFSSIGGFSPDISDGAEIGEIRFRSFVDGTNTSVGRWINGNLGIGNNVTAAAKVHIDQYSTTAATPVLYLDQADVDEPFTKYVGTAAAATLTRSIVAEADVTTATRQGFIKIEIEDVGNQVTDQDYFVPFFTLA
jgi:hypothetical protein